LRNCDCGFKKKSCACPLLVSSGILICNDISELSNYVQDPPCSWYRGCASRTNSIQWRIDNIYVTLVWLYQNSVKVRSLCTDCTPNESYWKLYNWYFNATLKIEIAQWKIAQETPSREVARWKKWVYSYTFFQM
jgi:hypothetical protein